MVSELPTGTVTFLFTDVAGSTALLHELGADAYANVLAEHRLLLRSTFAKHGGVEIDTQGDSFFAAFRRASDALAAARDGQAALVATPVRVRIGIHTGEPLVTAEGYAGMDVHKGARIAAAGHGGQVLVSEQTARLAAGEDLRDVGEHRLKDLTAPERIYQLGGGDFPPLKTLAATNLPVAASPLIGRELELAELMSLLRDGARLVTVTGAGGTGKTRFALQGAAELAGEFRDGVFWVPLHTLTDADLVLPAVAEAIGTGDDVNAYLRARRTLLLLDNLEQLLAAAPAVAELLADCPELKVLATSRAPLRIAGEHELPLNPLPDREASTLFLERARAAGRRLADDETVASICRRLDNLPLALELAAARTRLLDPGALLARLERSLPVLTGGRRDAPERQRTLRATIEWSFGLLDEDAKRLFARLAVFAGSFSVEAAEVICEADLDALGALVELSLLQPAGADRLRMMETIEEYARERLDASGESAELRSRHAEHFLAVAEQGDDEKDPERIADDHDNMRAALVWFRQLGDRERELRLAVDIRNYRWIHGHLAEQHALLTEALANAPGLDPGLHADARAALAFTSFFLGDVEEWRRSAEESLALARELGDKRRIEWALRLLTFAEDDPAEKRRLLGEAEALARELGDDSALAWVLHLLGSAALAEGDYGEARARMEEGLALNRRLGLAFEVANSLCDLGFVAVSDGRYDDARELAAEALRLAVADSTTLIPPALACLAAIVLSEGDPERAARLLARAARMLDETQLAQEEMYRPVWEATEAGVREALGNRLDQVWESGRALTVDEAVALALDKPD